MQYDSTAYSHIDYQEVPRIETQKKKLITDNLKGRSLENSLESY
jgi:hypothetical protein